MELHVPDTTHGLDLGLEGAEVIVVSVVTALKQVLVASVSGVLVTHPAERDMRGGAELTLSVSLTFSTGSLMAELVVYVDFIVLLCYYGMFMWWYLWYELVSP